MSPETEAFLESVRQAEDPTADDERRVLAAVQATLAAGAVIGTAAATSKLAQLWAWSASGGFKSGVAMVAMVAAAAGGVAAVTAALAPSATPSQARGGAVAKLVPVPRPAPLAKPQRSRQAERSTPPAPLAQPEPSPKPKPRPVASTLRDELAALAQAQAALRRGDGAAALRSLDAASARSPQLAAERATLRILSLCAVGRSVEARRIATDLERSEPGSLQRDAISRSCAGNKSSSGR